MEKKIISEEIVKNTLKMVIQEETSKVSRQEFSKVQFKIEELQNSLSETIKELRKLEDSVPEGLKTVSKGRISQISNNLMETNKVINQLKDKIRQYKRNLYAQSIEEKKK